MNPWLSKFLIWITCTVAVIGAPFLGVAIAGEDYFWMVIMALSILGLAYLLVLYQYTWQIALIFTTLGFAYAPLGFKISPDNLCIALITTLFFMMWWRKNLGPATALRQDLFFFGTRAIITILLAYGTIHFLWNNQYPMDPANYSWKNSIKTYLQFYGPFWLILYSMWFPQSLHLGTNLYRIICRILFPILLIGIGLRLYCQFVPGGIFILGTEEGAFFFLPGINLLENSHTLRWLSSFTVLLVGSILTAPGLRLTLANKLFMLLLLMLGFAAACLSGGRLAVILYLLLGACILLYRRRYKILIFSSMLILTLLGLVNVFSNVILNEHTPLMIRRTLVLLIFNPHVTNYEAQDSINSSAEWRKLLFFMALKDWQSNSRHFWFGRDVYAYNEEDIISISVMGANDAVLHSSLRRGATHNLLTDLLVIYGITGCILYLITLATILAMLFHFYRRLPANHYLEPLILSAFLYFLLGTFVIVANYSAWLIVLSMIGINQRYKQESLTTS